MSTTGGSSPIIKNVHYFITHYASGGAEDSRAIKDYKICETDEAVVSLRAELVAVYSGKIAPATLDAIVGKKRAQQYGSYQAWAKAMIAFLALPVH